MIRIGGNASPVFDHISVVGAHCGFHTNGGVNTVPVIKSSVLSGMSYGIMAYATKATFENNNFLGNSADVGFCFDATAENAPTMTGNFYSSGNVSYDAACFEIGIPDPSPAAVEHANAGPIGL
jgi:nitrous oxidase accessory protein NosD